MRCIIVSLLAALWLQSNQSTLVQETQSAKNIDLTHFETFPIKDPTCLQVGSTSLAWFVDPFARFDHSTLSPEIPSAEQQRSALPTSTRSHGRQHSLQAPPQVLQRTVGWDVCGLFLLRNTFWNTSGLIGSFSKQKNRDIKQHFRSPGSVERTSVSTLLRC